MWNGWENKHASTERLLRESAQENIWTEPCRSKKKKECGQ